MSVFSKEYTVMIIGVISKNDYYWPVHVCLGREVDVGKHCDLNIFGISGVLQRENHKRLDHLKT